MYKIKIPKGAREILSALTKAGYEAYVVGGCVRDSLLGIEPKDWDICTSATPAEVKRCVVKDVRQIVDTGLKHGTITIVMKDRGYEVTTYRKDGDYSDNRRPDSVEFVTSLAEDLSRRDFTINAMAYNETDGLVDKFDGLSALKRKEIVCVGNPDDRFAEDALRIMRALRFASTYGFIIQSKTAASIHRNKERLNNIAAERIQAELSKMLSGDGVLSILLEFSDVISEVIPEIKPCIGFEQNNKWHQYNVYEHMAHAVDNYKGSDIVVRTALFLHDIGKPQCYSEDEKGGHFHGHSVPSQQLAEQVLNRLHYNNNTKEAVLTLVLYHDSHIEPTSKAVKRWLNKLGTENFFRLLDVKLADISAHKAGTQEHRIEWCLKLGKLATTIIEESQCFNLKDLAIDGNVVMSLGVPQGKLVGDILHYALDKVMNGEIENQQDVLINEAKKYLTTRGE